MSKTDWKYWVVQHGNSKEVEADAREVGQITGII